MSPEERARSLYTRDPDIGLTPQAQTGIRVIAQAIREAENDAIEACAKQLEDDGFAYLARAIRRDQKHTMTTPT